MSRITVLGIAPGQKALDARALEKTASADLLVGATRHLALLGPCRGKLMAIEGRVGEAVELVAADPALTAVFLASGDPGFFGVGALLIKKLGRGEVEIIPAFSSLQLAFARLGESWSEARWASLHGKPLDSLAPLLGASRIGLLTDPQNTPASIAAYLIDAGWGELRMAVCEDLGEEGEKIVEGSPVDFTRWSGSPLNVVLLFDRAGEPRRLGPGLPDELFLHPRGRITKRYVRAAALSALELPQTGVLWDVGAGSGSVAIEAALLRPYLTVFAIEKDPEALGHIRENRRRLKAARVTVVDGEAPRALSGLPAPDRVFIGGSGGNIESILELAFSAMNPGGLALVSTVLTETFQAALAWAASTGRTADWNQLQVSHSKTTGSGTRLSASDPVTLLQIRREDIDG